MEYNNVIKSLEIEKKAMDKEWLKTCELVWKLKCNGLYKESGEVEWSSFIRRHLIKLKIVR